MRKLTTKLLFAIISAAFALVALGTTTFAWFTLTNEATISPFNAEITAGEGIEISLDGTNFYTTIPATVIQAKINSMNIELKDVTSSDGIEMTEIDGETTVPFLPAPGEDDKNAFIQFDLWVRSPKAGTKVQLKSVTFDSKIKNPEDTLVDPTPWNTDVIFANAKGKLVVPYADAAELIAAAPALIEAGIIEDFEVDSEEETLVSVTYRNDEDIFTDENIEFGPKAYYAEDALRLSISDGVTTVVYQKADDTTNTLLGAVPNPNGMVDYYKNKNGIDLITEYTPITLPTTTEVTTNNKPLLTTLGDANEPTELTVRIWVEGWDPDTFNAILKQVILAHIVFGSTNA